MHPARSIGRSSTGGGPRPFNNVATRHSVLDTQLESHLIVRVLYIAHAVLSGASDLQ